MHFRLRLLAFKMSFHTKKWDSFSRLESCDSDSKLGC